MQASKNCNLDPSVISQRVQESIPCLVSTPVSQQLKLSSYCLLLRVDYFFVLVLGLLSISTHQEHETGLEVSSVYLR